MLACDGDRRALPRAQYLHRVHLRCAHRGDIAREQTDSDEKPHHAHERNWVVWAHSVYHAFEESGERACTDDTERNAGQCQPRTLPHHEADDRAARRAKRDTYADLAAALLDQVRHDAVDTE